MRWIRQWPITCLQICDGSILILDFQRVTPPLSMNLEGGRIKHINTSLLLDCQHPLGKGYSSLMKLVWGKQSLQYELFGDFTRLENLGQ